MEEETYSLTPKGFLHVHLMEKDIDVDKLWDDLTTFVAQQAKANGMPDGGTPCLVMVDGGVCITAEAGN